MEQKEYQEENVEVGNFGGWEIISQRMKEANKITANYIDLLKQVASAMDTFGRALIKTARDSRLPDMEHGELKASLLAARTSVEYWGQDSVDAADAITTEVTQLSQYLTQAKLICKHAKEQAKQRQQQVREGMRRVQQAQRESQKKLQELMDKETNKLRVDSKPDAKPKELEKNKEEHRVRLVRDSLWRIANICSLFAVQLDQHQESIRTALIHVDVAKELSTWVAIHKTLQTPPIPLVYTPIARSSLNTPSASFSTSARSTLTEVSEDSDSSGRSSPIPLYKARALYQFSARNYSACVVVLQSESEVSLTEGQSLVVMDVCNAEWSLVRTNTGVLGFVPSKFITAAPVST
ncbi:proline-serine-threonine phosphatase-interacting protein 1 isoform X3 [Cherax quadricarinatus]|uniref:proline-serine-threonine phosphatase-interacting protein 1 isoform X3 n=1 Tax=Cherax quadricarinatus TaxID=27406 RepID=UPI00387E5FE6